MKRSFKLSLVAFVFWAACSHFAGNCIAGNPKTADPVQTIRQQYTAINNRVRRYKIVKKELSGFSLEGGEMTAYFDGTEIVKIVASHFGESGKALEEYYYLKGQLIFVFRKDQQYDKPMSGRVVRTQENRFYFQNDRLIRWLNEKGRQVAPATAEYQQKQDDYLQTSSKFFSGARSKNATIEAE